MANLIKYKLGDITKIKTGKLDANASSPNGKYPFFTCSRDILNIDSYSYDCECVLVAGNGDLNVKYYNGKFDAYQRTYIIEDNSDGRLYMPYLYFFLELYIEELRRQSIGGVIKYIKLGNLTNAIIKLPSIEKQKNIVDILQKSRNIINNKDMQLKEYDQLIKSRFVEMFGDIFTNEKSFKVGLFEDYVEQMNIGPFGSALKNEYFVSKEDSYCMVYEQKHAIRKDIDIDRRYVTFDKYKELQRFEIGPGDLIVSCRGTIGECHLLPKNAPMGIIHPSLMMIKPKKHVNGRFLLYLLEKILERQLDSGSGVKMAIQAKELAKVKTIIPEKNIQDDYVFFVEQVDKLKFEVLKLLGELR